MDVAVEADGGAVQVVAPHEGYSSIGGSGRIPRERAIDEAKLVGEQDGLISLLPGRIDICSFDLVRPAARPSADRIDESCRPSQPPRRTHMIVVTQPIIQTVYREDEEVPLERHSFQVFDQSILVRPLFDRLPRLSGFRALQAGHASP